MYAGTGCEFTSQIGECWRAAYAYSVRCGWKQAVTLCRRRTGEFPRHVSAVSSGGRALLTKPLT